MALSGPERVFDIAIVSKVPVAFARVMFAPEILANIQQLADDFKEEIAQLRVIARDAAITAELWLRSKHGTWRFFLVTPNSLVEIDRGGNRLVPGQTVAYMGGTLSGERNHPPPEKPLCFPDHTGARLRSGYTSFPSPSHFPEVIIRKNAEPGRNSRPIYGGNGRGSI
jgi:hypothetical protein